MKFFCFGVQSSDFLVNPWVNPQIAWISLNPWIYQIDLSIFKFSPFFQFIYYSESKVTIVNLVFWIFKAKLLNPETYSTYLLGLCSL